MGAPRESPAASIDAPRPAQNPDILNVAIAGRIERTDPVWFGERVSEALGARQTADVVCDVGGLLEPDAVAIDVICRIRLAARRHGAQVVLRSASPGLLELLDLTGLCDVLYVAGSALEAEGQPEEREHPGRVEEERDRPDPIA